jgi:hypothetical protein
MDVLLHTPSGNNNLSIHYERAFKNAVELFVVTAYLTEWDSSLALNPSCSTLRIIIGSDFGITRKAACEKVMRWLPSNHKSKFLVADGITGFHPKAVFWKDAKGAFHAVIGSSNLTRAAFDTNYEANILCSLSEADYRRARKWVDEIEAKCEVVCEDWLIRYKEATAPAGSKRSTKGAQSTASLVELRLPTPPGMRKRLQATRDELVTYRAHKDSLEQLFRRCAANQIKSEEFYRELQADWSFDVGDRLQGAGWEIKGKHSDFQELSHSFVRILDAADADRDDVVSEEIDRLSSKSVPTRGAFLSEMLCLRFPDAYPVLNDPVWKYLHAVRYKAPRKSSEGARYIFLARALRGSLRQNPNHPAKNLAELDTVIWLAYGKKER